MSKRTVYTLIAIATVLVLLAIFIPRLTGSIAEEQYGNFQQNLATEQNVAIKQQSYEKGWWSSKADSVMSVPGVAENVTLTHEVNHGLMPVIPVSAQSTITADGLVKEYADKIFGPTGPLTFSTSLGPTGSGHTEFQLLANDEAEGQRLEGTIDFSRGYVEGDFFSRSIAWGDPLQLGLVDLKLLFEQSGEDSRLETMLQVMEARIETQGEPVDLNRFELDVQLESTSSRVVDLALKHKTDFVQYAGARYGPVVEFKVSNIDTHILGKFFETISNMPEFQRNLMLPMMVMQHSPVFLGHSPEIEIPKLEITTEDGKLSAKLFLGVKPFGDAKITSLLQMVEYFHGEGECVADEGVLRMIARNRVAQELAQHAETPVSDSDIDKLAQEWLSHQLAEPLEKGYLVKTDNGYQTKFKLDNGKVQLNGQEMPLSNFVGMMF